MPRIVAGVAAVAGDLELPAVLRRAVATARELTGAREAVLAVFGEDGEVAEYVGGDRRPTADVLEVPIRVRDEPYGALYLVPDGDGFGETDREVLFALAGTAGMAIENARLFERVQVRERWLAASYHVTGALLAEHDLASTLRLIAERARVVAGGTAGAVARPDGHGRLVFEVVEPAGDDADKLAGLSVPLEGTASGRAYTTRRPVVVRHYGEHVLAQQAPIADRLPAVLKDMDSTIAIPLLVGDDTLGVLVVAKFRDRTPFTPTDVKAAETFAAHAALAVEFARAQEARQRLAVFEDRDRIARDLHDLVIQRLFATGLGLEGVSRLIGDPAVADRVAGFAQDLDRTIREIRNSIFSLQAPSHAPGSLRAEMLRVALDAAGALGFEPRVGFAGPLDAAVPDVVRPDLLAALREALSNVARHASANTTSVDVEVDGAGARVRLAVADDGAGPPSHPDRHSGLANLTARARRWGGTCVLTPAAGGGTRLEWVAELPGQAHDEGRTR